MALPALLGAGARAVGGSMVKAGGRVVADKVLGRDRKTQPGRSISSGGEGRGGAIVPRTKMVSAKEIKSLQTGDTVSPGKDPLKSIYSNVILIEKILKGTVAADRDALNEQKKNDKKSDKDAQEKKLETKPSKIDKKKGEVMKLPETGIFGFLKNFIGNILMGYFAVRLIKYLPQIMELLKGLGRVVEFVTDVGMFLVDGIASFINFAYNVYDGTRNIMKGIGLEGPFDAVMKAMEVAITVLTFALGAKSLGGFDGRGGTAKTPQTRVRTKPQEAFQAGRPKRMQPPGTTSQGAASRYARRYGEGAAKKRFGQAAGKKAAQQAAGKLGVRGAARILGPVVKRIPVIGGLIEFVLSVVSGDSVGKAAFRAVGSGLGTWIGGALGSLIPVPFVGTAIGAFVGGTGGAELAGVMYDAFFGGKEKQMKSDVKDKKRESSVPSSGTLDTPSAAVTSLGSGGGSLKYMGEQEFSDLAFIVSHEALRKTDDEYGVAAAVLNRVADPRYPNTIMGVGTAPGQFEAVFTGKAYRDEALAKQLMNNQGKIIDALKKLDGRTDFKAFSSMGQFMGETDIMFADNGNFYHYAEQRSKSDPIPSNIPQDWKKLLGENSSEEIRITSEAHPEPKRSHAGTKLSNREQMLKILPGQSLLDENTSKALGANNLARFNAASTPQAIQNIAGQIAGVSDYAPYEQGAQQTIMVQDPPQQMSEELPQSSGGGMMAMSGGSGHDPFEFLDFQG